jgi:hypothetical protein
MNRRGDLAGNDLMESCLAQSSGVRHCIIPVCMNVFGQSVVTGDPGDKLPDACANIEVPTTGGASSGSLGLGTRDYARRCVGAGLKP